MILITGATSGIGKALALELANQNKNLCLVGRDEFEIESVSNICRQQGVEVYSYIADVSKIEQMRNVIATIKSNQLAVRTIIANAGVRYEEDPLFQDHTVVHKNMDANYFGVVNTITPFFALEFTKTLKSIVIVSSIGALRGTPNSGAYSASKAAINIWAESLRLRLHKNAISVTVVNMGFVATRMTEGLPFKMPGILSAENAAKKIINAAHKKKRDLIVPWQSKLIWGIFVALPNVFYDKLILWAKSKHRQVKDEI